MRNFFLFRFVAEIRQLLAGINLYLRHGMGKEKILRFSNLLPRAFSFETEREKPWERNSKCRFPPNFDGYLVLLAMNCLLTEFKNCAVNFVVANIDQLVSRTSNPHDVRQLISTH